MLAHLPSGVRRRATAAVALSCLMLVSAVASVGVWWVLPPHWTVSTTILCAFGAMLSVVTPLCVVYGLVRTHPDCIRLFILSNVVSGFWCVCWLGACRRAAPITPRPAARPRHSYILSYAVCLVTITSQSAQQRTCYERTGQPCEDTPDTAQQAESGRRFIVCAAVGFVTFVLNVRRRARAAAPACSERAMSTYSSLGRALLRSRWCASRRR